LLAIERGRQIEAASIHRFGFLRESAALNGMNHPRCGPQATYLIEAEPRAARQGLPVSVTTIRRRGGDPDIGLKLPRGLFGVRRWKPHNKARAIPYLDVEAV
jgi:hypothetical protein